MNIFKKAFCRTYQTAFKLAIPILPYRDPYILHSVGELPSHLSTKGIKKVLIVTDSFLNSSPLITTLKSALENGGIDFEVFSETVSNPTVKNVEDAKKLYIISGANALIGFGGGSSIDCAKAVGARIARPNKSIAKMKGILQILKKTPFTVAIPTTAGTGSETTVTTVITDEETHHKFPVSDFPLIPDVAVLDPEMTRTLPPSLTATTGMDALTHAVEAFIGNSTVKSSRNSALAAAKLIFENIEKAYSDSNDMTARKNMLTAAFHAGSAFSKSYVGYCHAVAHSLGGKYSIPHGLANAVLLPYVLKAYGKSAYKKLKILAITAGLAVNSTPEKTAAEKFIEKICELNCNMNIPDKLEGISEKDIPTLAKYAEKEANPLYPVPKLFTSKELEQFYYDVRKD